MVLQKKCILISIFGIIIITAIILIVVLTIKTNKNVVIESAKRRYKANVYKRAAVAADASVCSTIGKDVLKKNGSVADAAVATMFCTGVVNIHSCGIGGGTFLIFYERKTKTFTAYDFRETAPYFAFEEMFVNKSENSKYGGSSVAIPGEVSGLWKLHKEHGKLSWAELIEPSVRLARDGITVTKSLFDAIESIKNKNMSSGLRKLLTNQDRSFLRVGDILKNPELAKTLATLQKDPDSFYNGSLRDQIVKELNINGGNVTEKDFSSYTVKVRKILNLTLPDGLTLHTLGAPSGGPIVAVIYNIMSGYNSANVDLNKIGDQVEFYQKTIESMKFGYAQRGLLGDPDFVPHENITEVYNVATNLSIGKLIRQNKIKLNETFDPKYYGGFWAKDDFGTSHVSILAENGDAISCTSTINAYFGSKFRSEVTGIIYNNEMDDFSTPGVSNLYGYPPTPANYIRPGKRPLSSMSPTIVTDADGDVKMVVGASGGSRIISGTAQVMLKTLHLGIELGEAVTSYRLHHQGIPNEITYNPDISPVNDVLERLKTIGHKISRKDSKSVVQAILRKNKQIFAMSDPRKFAQADGY